MSHHKRKKCKNARAGCLLCKPHKANGQKKLKEKQSIKTGFGRIRKLRHQKDDLNNDF